MHQRISCFRVYQFAELFQNLCHFISTFTTSDVDDNVCVRPFCNLMLCHGLSCSETTRYGSCAAFCNREHGVQNTLTCDQRFGSRKTFAGGTGNTNRPLLAEGQFLCAAVCQLKGYNRVQNRVFSIGNHFDHGSFYIWRNHGFVQDRGSFLGLCDDGTAGDEITLRYSKMNLPFFLSVKRIYADTSGNIFAGLCCDFT